MEELGNAIGDNDSKIDINKAIESNKYSYAKILNDKESYAKTFMWESFNKSDFYKEKVSSNNWDDSLKKPDKDFVECIEDSNISDAVKERIAIESRIKKILIIMT